MTSTDMTPAAPDDVTVWPLDGYKYVENSYISLFKYAPGETGVTPVAAHVPLSRLETSTEPVIDRRLAVGCRCVVVLYVGVSHFWRMATIDLIADHLTAL
jgi:hypothetical protein